LSVMRSKGNSAKQLKQTVRGVFEYGKKQGIAIFLGEPMPSKRPFLEMEWSGPENWRAFLDVARKAGAKVIVVDTHVFGDEDMGALKDCLVERKDRSVEEKLAAFKKHVGEASGVRMFWFHEGVQYSFIMTSAAFDNFLTLMFKSEGGGPPCAPCEIWQRKRALGKLSPQESKYMS